MPRSRKPTKAQIAQLASLPRRPELVLEGGKRSLGIAIEEGRQVVIPEAVIWVDAPTGLLRAAGIISPAQSRDAGVGEALEQLVFACTGPFQQLPPDAQQALDQTSLRRTGKRTRRPPEMLPGLPARVRTDDLQLAAAARAIFEPLGVSVERADDVPAFDAAFQSLATFLQEEEEETEPFAWDIDPALLPPLFKAAAGFWRRAPWDYMPDHPPLAIELGTNGPEPGQEILYGSIMGAAGLVSGFCLYYSLDDLWEAMRAGHSVQADDADIDAMVEVLRQAGAPIDQLPADMVHEVVGGLIAQQGADGQTSMPALQRSLLLFYTPTDETDTTYVEWVNAHGLKAASREGLPSFVRTEPGHEPRSPNPREIRAMTLAIEAANQFFSQHGRHLQQPFLPPDPLAARVRVSDGAQSATVAVTFPPPDYDWDQDEAASEGPSEPLPEGAATTLYRLHVQLAWEESVWRRIELRGDQTLHDLHGAIQDAFEWDDDHLYAFFLSGRPWDEETEYESPHGEGRSAARFALAQLPLRARKKILYIFDFGDELRHWVRVEAIDRHGVEPGATYPRIVERHGASVPQYPDIEEWDDEASDELGDEEPE